MAIFAVEWHFLGIHKGLNLGLKASKATSERKLRRGLGTI